MWMITNVARSVDGCRLRVRGLSEYARDEDATFYTALDEIEVLDPVQPIEDQAFDGIAKVYARQRKQTFLAIDKISRYSEETRQILTESAFIHLEPGRELFGRSWSKKKKRKVADSE